jgi:hypothetical protein
MKRITKVLIATFGTISLVSNGGIATAEVYSFNRFIEKVYIKDVKIDFLDRGVNLSVDVRTPSCPNQYHVDGYVKVSYKNNGGFVSRKWTFSGSDEENKDMRYADFLPYRQSPGAPVNIEAYTTCNYHGVRHGGIRLPW